MFLHYQHCAKMWSDCFVFALFVSELFSLSFAGKNADRELLGRAVQNALGFNRQNVPRGTPPTLDEQMEGTRYMVQLYENYRQGLTPKGLDTNTVRSIQASTGKINGEDMFLFNLSAVSATGQVLNADIHFFKRKQRRDNLHMYYFEVAPDYLANLSSIDLDNPSYGWQANDATDAVQSCLAVRRDQPHLLAVRFVKVKYDRRGKLNEMKIPVRKFMFHHSKPFLVVYSNDTQNISLDHLDTYFKASEVEKEKSKVNEVNSWRNKPMKGVKRKVMDDNAVNALHRLFKRSIYDNEIPQDPSTDVFTYQRKDVGFNIPHTNPSILQGRQKPKRDPVNTQYIPYPKQYRRRKKGRKNRRRNRKKNRSREEELPAADQWKDWVNAQNLSDDEKMQMWTCGKKKLILDFADIGWSDWIIAPKSFEANYCSGNCSFPLRKEHRPSNHATIQSIVHAVGLNRAVPEPCCVPDVMSSVTLLYMDENANVVLKNYPSMTVESCGCR